MKFSEYKATIGLEIHAHLKTKTKMFSASKNDPEETSPNSNVSPIDLAHPGTLPTINKEAIRHVLKVGIACGGTLADFTEFDRKNYFYPDIPKGYQISQYKYPLVKGGQLAGVSLTRIHLEEDTGTSIHDQGDYSLLNYNRAGTPLMELVTEPVIANGEDAQIFARELQLLLQCVGAGDANLEKGEMRIEANISISNTSTFGTKVEVKNLNSFRAVEKAIEYEIDRHTQLLQEGGEVIQETRGWDEKKEITFSQRAKEDSHDYRYFPDPDLPKLKISKIPEFSLEVLKKELPELPWEKRLRFATEYNLKPKDIDIFLYNQILSDYFEEVVAQSGKDVQKLGLIFNYITSDIIGLTKNDSLEFLFERIPPLSLASLVTMIVEGDVSSRGAKDVLKKIYTNGGDPKEIAQTEGLIQKSDEGELKELAHEIISENQEAVKEYKNGKEASLQFLVGQGMKKTKGSANPTVLQKIIKGLLV